MSAKVQVYTRTQCSYCVSAKDLLKRKNVAFEEINLDGRDQELEALCKRTGIRTVPQIIIDDEVIGGYTDLAKLEAEGTLNQKLGL